MKTNIILIALFVPAFMFLSTGSVDTANAETDISHCANLEATAARPACEAAAHVKSADPTFDDTLMKCKELLRTGDTERRTGMN